MFPMPRRLSRSGRSRERLHANQLTAAAPSQTANAITATAATSARGCSRRGTEGGGVEGGRELFSMGCPQPRAATAAPTQRVRPRVPHERCNHVVLALQPKSWAGTENDAIPVDALDVVGAVALRNQPARARPDLPRDAPNARLSRSCYVRIKGELIGVADRSDRPGRGR